MSKASNSKTSLFRCLTLLVSWCRGHSLREYEIKNLQYGGLIVLVFSLLSLLFPKYMPGLHTVFKTTMPRNSFNYVLFLLIMQWIIIVRFKWLKQFALLIFATWILLDFLTMIYTKGVICSLYYYISFYVLWHFVWMLWKLLQSVISRCFIYDFDKEDYLAIYQDQLEKQGSLNVNIIECMTIGPPTVGKTTLKEQLLANFDENNATVKGINCRPHSSSVCENVKRIQVKLNDNKCDQSPLTVAVDKRTWRTLSLDEQILDCLKIISKDNKRTDIPFWTCLLIVFSAAIYIIAAIMYNGPYSFDKSVEDISTLHNNIFYSIVFSVLLFLVLFLIKMTKLDLNASNIIISDVVREALTNSDVSKVQSLFDQTLTIYFRDCGGQPEFHEVLPALASRSSLFLLVFNLSEDLDTQYKVTYKTSAGEVSDPYVSSFTVKQTLLQCLASAASCLKPYVIFKYTRITFDKWLRKTILKMPTLRLLIIGTHKDQLSGHEIDDVINCVNKQLEDEVKGTDWYSTDMIIPTENDKILLGINTFCPNDIKKVKDLVNEAARDYQLEIPIPWLAFDFCIRKLGKKVMTVNECLCIAQECQISCLDEFVAALLFLHNNIGTIRYFHNVPVLQNVVITDPQLLFDIVTDLIVNTFSFKKRIQRKSEHDKFRFSGRFTKRHLENCKYIQEKLLSIEQVIAILEHLVIIAPVGINESNEQEYFLPCILVHASLPSTPVLHNDCDIPPLLITFRCHYTPRGIFSSLIARILLDGKGKLRLVSEEIYRDHVKFYLVKSGHIVSMTNFFRFIEIDVRPPHGSSTKDLESFVYISLQCYISQCLKFVKDHLNYTDTSDFLFGFHCSCKKHYNDDHIEDHPAECNDNCNPTYIKCSLKRDFTVKLLPQQQAWFCEKGVVAVTDLSCTQKEAEIDITQLDNVIDFLKQRRFPKSSWQSLGLQLGLYQPTLDDIDAKHRGNQTNCLQACIAAWLEKNDKVAEKGRTTFAFLETALNKLK